MQRSFVRGRPLVMCEGRPGGHPELWVSPVPKDRGPEGNVQLWRGAEEILDRMCAEAEEKGFGFNDGALCALTDAYNRCIEERRRAEDLLKLHSHWARRPIGLVTEPESPVAD